MSLVRVDGYVQRRAERKLKRIYYRRKAKKLLDTIWDSKPGWHEDLVREYVRILKDNAYLGKRKSKRIANRELVERFGHLLDLRSKR